MAGAGVGWVGADFSVGSTAPQSDERGHSIDS